jgi:BCD family chlorophyll transporter-like MFS transporter
MTATRDLSWFGIARLGVVQAALGAVVVLATSTMNRVMVVELGLPALLPGVLIAWHYAVQVLRPRLGYGSDVGRRRTPWIIGGVAVLAAGGIGAACAVALMATMPILGAVLALVAFTMIGLGVGAGGTSLLVLLAKQVAAPRRAAAATIVWIMMICGFVVTAAVSGRTLDPFSPLRLIEVTAGVALTGLVLTVLAVWRLEVLGDVDAATVETDPTSFRQALAQVWTEAPVRRFAIFVFLAMLAYGALELLIEPFGGGVFGLTPGESAQLAGMQHGGVLIGMIMVGVAGRAIGAGRPNAIRGWTMGGCIASAVAVAALAIIGLFDIAVALRPAVMIAGIANGAFSIAAIGTMMGLADTGRTARAGVRMGLWGAAQALAFAGGGLLGTSASDIARTLIPQASGAYAAVFCGVTLLFVAAAVQAARVFERAPATADRSRVTRHAYAQITQG